MATIKPITIKDVEQLPSDACRYDLIRGELVRMPPTGWSHSTISSRLNRRIGIYVELNNLGETATSEPGFILHRNPDVLLSPDVAFVSNDRLPPDDYERFAELAPDLAVEVISPSERPQHIQVKIDEYLLAGVRQVWIVEPRQRTVTIHTPDAEPIVFAESDSIDGGEVLPGFELAVADIFS